MDVTPAKVVLGLTRVVGPLNVEVTGQRRTCVRYYVSARLNLDALRISIPLSSDAPDLYLVQ